MKIDFGGSDPPLFVAGELSLPAQLTIFGCDLPEFRSWAGANGVREFHLVDELGEYLKRNHELVAHLVVWLGVRNDGSHLGVLHTGGSWVVQHATVAQPDGPSESMMLAKPDGVARSRSSGTRWPVVT